MIRRATASDEPAIRQCAERAYSRYVAAIGKRPAPMDADYLALITAGQVHVSVDQHQQLLGYIAFYPQGDCMLLDSVAVLPEAAGRGVGKALIQFCEDTARHHKLRAVQLYTNEKMRDNLAIYPRLGYRETERLSEDGFRRVFFEKRLV